MHYDVIVAGGGVAGAAAAVEAARSGMKVALVEKTTLLGGLATIGLVNYFEPMCNGQGTLIIRGLAEEFLRLAVQYGFDTIPEAWKNGEPGQGNAAKRLISHFSAPIFSLVLCELLHKAGVTLYFDTVVTGVDAANGHIRALHIFNKSGHRKLEGSLFVDTTGDADVLHFAGVPTVTRGNYHTYSGFHVSLENCRAALEAGDIAKLFDSRLGGSASWRGKNHPEGKSLWDGTDGEQVSRYLVENQLELLEKIKGDDRKSRDITMLPGMPQFRTTRCISGNHVFREEDSYLHFEDSVGAICDWTKRVRLYEVPYGTLIRDGFDNVITAGRCACAEGVGWDILRVIPPAILTGQAAGAAASLAVQKGISLMNMDIPALQDKLASEGVMIHFDDSLVPEEAQ